MLAQCGARLIDADAISRQLTAPGGAALGALAAAFGSGIFDPSTGHLDRTQLRELVFGDPRAKGRLEAILHPLIGLECDRQAALAPSGAVLVFDVPLLVESLSRWRPRIDRVLVIDCSESLQLQRVMQRSGWSGEAAQAVISQQASRDERLAVADDVIVNEGLTMAQLNDKIEALWKRWSPVEQSSP